MKQAEFEARNNPFWARLEQSLAQVKDGSPSLPADHRQVCQHLAVARHRQYTDALIERLQALTQKSQARLYRPRSQFLREALSMLAFGFPRSVRANLRWVALSALFFFGPFITMLITILIDPDMVHTVLSPREIAMFESMYEPGHTAVGMFRNADSNFLMFAFYVSHNTAIGLRTFAAGLLFWIGTLFFLLFNGFAIGAVAGHLTHLGYYETFWGFVSGHSAMELSAIVISGAAGLKLGFPLIYPGQFTRAYALKTAAVQCLPLVYGFMTLFFIAALLEAYWSAPTIYSAQTKYTVGVLLWLILLLYFIFMGRGKRAG